MGGFLEFNRFSHALSPFGKHLTLLSLYMCENWYVSSILSSGWRDKPVGDSILVFVHKLFYAFVIRLIPPKHANLNYKSSTHDHVRLILFQSVERARLCFLLLERQKISIIVFDLGTGLNCAAADKYRYLKPSRYNSRAIIRNRMMLFINTISTILLLLPALGQAQRRCTTPIGQSGTCLPIRQCQYYTDLEDRYAGSLPRSVRNQLLLMQCTGEQRRDFHLCCPRQSGVQAQSLSPPASERKPVRSVSTDPSSWQQISQSGMRVLESVTNCGLKNNQKVAGGENAQLGQFPWLALLKYEVEGRPFLCGGSLISDRYVITAAHCVVQSAKLIGVRLGEHDLNSNPDCQILGGRFRDCSPVYEDFGIEKIQPHPGYVHGSIRYDIALIKLDRSASSYSHIQPICLPIEPNSQAIAYNQDFYIAGWGQTETRQVASVLQKAVVSRQSLDVCRNYFSNAPVSNNHICAAGEGLPHTCQGDSGGPLFFRHKFRNTYRFIQYGVVSFGGKFCGSSESKPGIYANIIDMLPWITQNLD